MSLSRKNKRELKKLRSHAADLWQEQRDVLERANSVVQEAAQQARKLSNQHVVPKVRGAVDTHVRPGFDRGYGAAKSVGSTARQKLVVDLLPGIATALGSITAVANLVESDRVEHTLARAKKASKAATAAGRKLAERYVPGIEPEPKRNGLGAGGVIAIVAGAIVVAGVGYAFWQTFRADDDLWIADDDVDAAPTSASSSTPPATIPPSVTGTTPIEPGTII
jgi:hypothetical protein